MFKNFWYSKRHIIESTGILTAIGALFLAVPLPGDDAAKNALINIQMIWLLIISIMSLFLIFQFASFAINVEKNVETKLGHETQSYFFIFVFVTGWWFLYNLWKYMILLYKNELREFLFSLTIVPLSVASLPVFYFRKKYIKFYIDKQKLKYIATITTVSLGAGLIYAFLTSVIVLRMEMRSFGMWLLIGFLVAMIYCMFSVNSYVKKHKNN